MPGVRSRAALCRCGASRNKPFCDGAHDKSGFRDHGAVGERGAGTPDDGGLLSIECAKNGPLLIRGNFSIRAGSGRVAYRGTKASLCRCGHSNNRPFCDGSHKAAGFEAG
jgi:CDGSH-type Zn-finger protein